MVSTSEARAEQLAIRRTAAARLIDIFPALDFTRLDDTASGWVYAVERVTLDAHRQIGDVAEDAYRQQRRAAGAAGRVSFIVPDVDRGKLRASLEWLGPRSAKQQLAGGARIPDVARTVLSNTTGSALLDVMKAGRDGTRTTSLQDPAAAGWMRIARENACKFCRMLAAKGAVYKEATAHFAAHPHCSCTAQAVFRGETVGPEASVMQYMASSRTRTPQEKAALRAWLDAEYPDE